MSCFIVSEETMHRVVRALDTIQPAPDDTARTVIGRLLFTMNNDAFKQRYEGRYREDMATPESYGYEAREAATGELYKAVACFLYQCSEGTVPESGLYGLVRLVEQALEAELTGDSTPSPERGERAFRMVSGVPWDF